MIVPDGFTEAQVVEIMEKVARALRAKFRFGYHELEDMEQIGHVYALKFLASGKYDGLRPLENILYTHVRNRLINHKRDNYIRNDPPCKTCIFFDPARKKSTNQCAVYADKVDCAKLEGWKARNLAKQNIMRPVDVGLLTETLRAAPTHSEAEVGELENLIDMELSPDLRSDYLRMLAGQPLAKAREEAVRAAVREIIGGDNG